MRIKIIPARRLRARVSTVFAVAAPRFTTVFAAAQRFSTDESFTGASKGYIAAVSLTWVVAISVVAALFSPPVAVAQSRIEDLALVILPAPDFKKAATPPAQSKGRGGLRLVVSSSRANQITDIDEWFKRNGLALPSYDVTGAADGSDGQQATPLPANVPRSYKGNMLTRAITQNGGTLLLVYGRNYAEGRYVFSMNANSGTFRYGFDFGNYVYPPDYVPGQRSLVYQNIDWAIEEGDTLYVSHSHATYARTSRGMNAYITAINFRTGRVLWRSQPLVSNASNFEMAGDVIVSGYGFTNEPDFLYLLDKRTGRELHRLPVKSGATYIIRKGERIYVRTYNADLIVGIVAGKR